METLFTILSILSTLGVIVAAMATYKPRTKPVRRSNGQVAHKIPVQQYGEVVGYIHI